VDLTSRLLRLGAGRPHVLLVEAPGGTEPRLAVEREARTRGWPAAGSPADADLVVIAGRVTDDLAAPADRLGRQAPRPRVRLAAPDASSTGRLLEEAAARLAAGGDLEDDAPASAPPESHSSHSPTPPGDHAGHGDMEMDMPGGVPMADRGEDRDGLLLDQLHVPLGPLLPDWPAGLVVQTTLQGDVIQDARVEVVGGPASSFWDEPWRRLASGDPVTVGAASRRRIAGHLDSLARLLTVAGWADAATRARQLRDELLAGAPAAELGPRLWRLTRRVRRSRTLRWLTDDLGAVPADTSVVRAWGDVTARWSGWLAAAEQLLPDIDRSDRLPLGDAPRDPPAELVAMLPGLLTGTELATARLVVASLDPDLAELGTPAEVPGG
jgi:hypothetical protein